MERGDIFKKIGVSLDGLGFFFCISRHMEGRIIVTMHAVKLD